MRKGDRVREFILQSLQQARSPLETREVVDLVLKAIPKATRTIVFKRLTDMRGDGLIKGQHIGSGKGVWIWWHEDLFAERMQEVPHRDKVVAQIHSILDACDTPLETTDIVDKVRSAIPKATRTIIFKRLTNLRGDQAINGKYVGSGKGVWFWWRKNAT